jgi:two-component system catabolic regulation response regulator CreB/two-component system response regulator ChvI
MESQQKRNKVRRILVVDDEPDHCLIYRMTLQDAGFECASYTDPVKALQEFRPNYYDLVILDIRMPVLNGFELCKRIMELDKKVHIIFITALPEYYKDIRNKSYPELRNTVYIQKPVTNEGITEIVNQTLGSGGRSY